MLFTTLLNIRKRLLLENQTIALIGGGAAPITPELFKSMPDNSNGNTAEAQKIFGKKD
ncbi:hypothetical protein [Flavobacterium rhizosphaerae]|uniref:Uncharacterized protein n=1 Tax=Flavobacterium rhizosphaerae TaxID=3163298 RepID=A0ABW8Z2S9_9FLAO